MVFTPPIFWAMMHVFFSEQYLSVRSLWLNHQEDIYIYLVNLVILLMFQKSGDHQLSLVACLTCSRVFIHPCWLARISEPSTVCKLCHQRLPGFTLGPHDVTNTGHPSFGFPPFSPRNLEVSLKTLSCCMA